MNNLCFLKHKNDDAALLNLDDNGHLVRAKIINPEYLPLGTLGKTVSDTETRLRDWWERRSAPKTQSGISLSPVLLEKMGKVLASNLGLSLSDTYWINPEWSDLTWEDVNLYDNPFSEAEIMDRSLEEITKDTLFHPGASLQGQLKKKWIRFQGGIYLVKGNYNIGEYYNGPVQSINERFATEIHMIQDRFPFVPYTLSKLFLEDDTSEYGCICPNFTSPDLEFIPAYYVCDMAQKRNDVSYKEHFIQVCATLELNQQHVSDFMDYMALTDYVITNYDRHFNNFGIIRDTNTMKIIDIAPIFDSGNSMFWNRPMPKTKYDLLNVEITSYVKKESKSLDMVKNFDVIDLSLLPDFDSIQSLYMEYGVPEQYAYKLAVIFTEKHQILEQVSSGQSIGQIKEKARKAGNSCVISY